MDVQCKSTWWFQIFFIFTPTFRETNGFLGGGFKDVLFSSLFGEDFHFDEYFSNGLKPPTRKGVAP